MLKKVSAQGLDLSKEFAFGNINSLAELYGYVISVVFIIAGIIILFQFIIASLRWLTSGGDKEAIAKARATLTNTIIGFLLMIFVFLVLQYLPEAIGLKGYKIF